MVGQIIKCVWNQTPLNGKKTVVSPNVISLHPEPFCVLHRTVLSRCVRACKSTSSTQESIKMGMESTAVKATILWDNYTGTVLPTSSLQKHGTRKYFTSLPCPL